MNSFSPNTKLSMSAEKRKRDNEQFRTNKVIKLEYDKAFVPEAFGANLLNCDKKELLALAHKAFELEHYAKALQYLDSIDPVDRDDLVSLMTGLIKCFKIKQEVILNDYVQFIAPCYDNLVNSSDGDVAFYLGCLHLEGLYTEYRVETGKMDVENEEHPQVDIDSDCIDEEDQCSPRGSGDAEGSEGSEAECLEVRLYERDDDRAFEYFRRAAETGHAHGQFALGKCYLEGVGVVADAAKAMALFLQSAEGLNARAQCALGKCYKRGIGVEANAAQGFTWYKAAANQGLAKAQYFVSMIYDNVEGFTREEDFVLKYLQLSAEQGYPKAQCRLGMKYLKGKGVPKVDKEMAKHYFKLAAEEDNAQAQYHLGLLLEANGNRGYALECFQNSSARGYSKSHWKLGTYYESEENSMGLLPCDPVKGFALYQQSAKKSQYRKANYELGKCYEQGIGCESNAELAFACYKLSAEKGYAPAHYRLGVCYDEGLGVEISEENSVKHYKIAAENGNLNAQFNLGLHYENLCEGDEKKLGDLLEKYKSDAFMYFKMAANQGDPEAQNSVGLCYKRGFGTRADDSIAHHYFQLSGDQGFPEGNYHLGKCHKNGLSVPKNANAALQCFIKGDTYPKSQFRIAEFYFNQYCIDQRENPQFPFAQILQYLEAAAGQGSHKAMHRLGMVNLHGHLGLPINAEKAFDYLKKAAAEGHTTSLLELGNCFQFGIGVAIDLKLAHSAFVGAAKKNDPVAYYRLGILEKETNLAKAVSLFKFAATKGNAESHLELGRCYRSGIGLERDLTLAIKHITQATQSALAEAHFELGECYELGEGVTQSLSDAFHQYRLGADRGHAESQYRAGTCLSEGRGVTGDVTRAFEYFLRSAQAGLVRSQLRVAQCYLHGEGTKRDETAARSFLLQAAKSGDLASQMEMARFYMRLARERNSGHALEEEREAFALFRLAAEQRECEALAVVANALHGGLLGQGVDRLGAHRYYEALVKLEREREDAKKAECNSTNAMDVEGNHNNSNKSGRTNGKASGDGYQLPHETLIEAKLRLAMNYEIGLSDVPKNEAMAFDYFKFCAGEGNAEAQYKLGSLYARGIGVAIDVNKALEYYTLAAKSGHAEGLFEVGNHLLANKKYLEAYQQYFQSAQQGSASAQYQVALHFLGELKRSLDRNVEERAVSEARESRPSSRTHSPSKKSSQKEKQARHALRASGTATSSRESIGIRFCKMAARQGFPQAQCLLAYYYQRLSENALLIGNGENEEANEDGIDVAENKRIRSEIDRFLTKCVDESPNGESVDDNSVDDRELNCRNEAKSYYVKAAAQDSERAQYHLGRSFRFGLVTNCDLSSSFYYYKSSADNAKPALLDDGCAANGASMFRVGVCYDQGVGVTANAREALRYFESAGKLGVAQASYNAAVIYLYGAEGVEKDWGRATQHFEIAERGGIFVKKHDEM